MCGCRTRSGFVFVVRLVTTTARIVDHSLKPGRASRPCVSPRQASKATDEMPSTRPRTVPREGGLGDRFLRALKWPYAVFVHEEGCSWRRSTGGAGRARARSEADYRSAPLTAHFVSTMG